MTSAWNQHTSFDAVCRRAGGRRHYNAVRRLKRDQRLNRVVELIGTYGLVKHGARARIARESGVHKSTITRDLQAILAKHREFTQTDEVKRRAACRAFLEAEASRAEQSDSADQSGPQ